MIYCQLNFTTDKGSKNHSQHEWSKQKLYKEQFTTTIDDDSSPLMFLDLNSPNLPSNDMKHQFNGALIMDNDIINSNDDDDRSSDSSCNISINSRDWPLSFDLIWIARLLYTLVHL